MGKTRDIGGHPALTDQETGLPNRLHFDTVFEVTFGIGYRGIPLTLILIEVDQYLEWRERTDSSVAAYTLRTLGLVLDGAVRQSDLVARTEDGRFALALLDCDLSGAESAAQRISGVLAPSTARAGLSVSMGVASYNQGMVRPEDLLGAAERALGEAQAQGGNEIRLHR